MSISFAVTWDYRCPFARNVHEHLVAGLKNGAPWDVTFSAFSLDQAHVSEGEASVFDTPQDHPGLLVNLAGIVVRDTMADKFLDTHLALFTARHDLALDTRDRKVIATTLETADVDSDKVFAQIDEGWPLEVARREHENAVSEHEVFGVPTFVMDRGAAFVRLMHRPQGNPKVAIAAIDKVLDIITQFPELNELKFTKISR